VTIANGRVWNEHPIGCRNKCLFCGYTWHRKAVGLETESDGVFGAGEYQEVTLR
jgi:hypothetical protein